MRIFCFFSKSGFQVFFFSNLRLYLRHKALIRDTSSLLRKSLFCFSYYKKKTKAERGLGECQQSLLTFPPLSSSSLLWPLIYDSRGREVGSPCLVLGRGQGRSPGLGHKLMKVSNLDTPVN